MRYRAPEGVTALCCAGEAMTPDETGVFEAAAELSGELSAHGCVAVPDGVEPRTDERTARVRTRPRKAN